MWAAVELLYRDGVKGKPSWPKLVGEIRSEVVKGVPTLRLIDLSQQGKPALLVLWKPELLSAGCSHINFAGLEQKGEDRHRWFAQAWRCELLSHQSAMTYHEPRVIMGELPCFYETNKT